MDVFLTKSFQRWRAKERLSDRALCAAIDEMERGLIDANLGGGLYKKRVARMGAGKSGSYRTLIAVRFGDRAIFVFGFGKSERGNIDRREERALKAYAKALLGLDSAQVAQAIRVGEWVRLRCDGG